MGLSSPSSIVIARSTTPLHLESHNGSSDHDKSSYTRSCANAQVKHTPAPKIVRVAVVSMLFRHGHGKRDTDRQLSREEHPGLLVWQHANASADDVTNPIGAQVALQLLSMKAYQPLICMVPNTVETPPAQVEKQSSGSDFVWPHQHADVDNSHCLLMCRHWALQVSD